MPYTPPSRRSPASSTGTSPTLTRNHSYEKSQTSTTRPELPRSSSAAYIHKHRRTPSLADNKAGRNNNHVTHMDGMSTVVSSPTILKSSPKKLVIAEKFTASPIEAGSSEDDEDRGRSRQIQDLAESLKESMMVPKRQSSPKRSGEISNLPVAKVIQSLENGTTIPGALTPEAIKIAHSRSSSEVQLTSTSNPLQIHMDSSPIDSDEEGLEMKRVPLLRKKSGELVKPALRGSSHGRRPLSAPGTPTYPKAVHFNDEMEQVRHFLQIDKPIAVSAGSSPVEIYDSESDYPFSSDGEKKSRGIEWEIKLTNFPKVSPERQYMPVRVEQIFLSKDFKTLTGIVAAANLAFEKYVTARFTFDYWKTTSEMAAEYSKVRPQKIVNDGYDRFTFNIKLSDQANLQNKTMYICVRYNVGGEEHWDNNDGNNFQIDFIRKLPAKQILRVSTGVAQGNIPRSRHAGGQKIPRPRSFPASSAEDEFSTSYDSPFRLRQDSGLARKKDQPDNDSAQHPSVSRLSTRYDFHASLHAALMTAQNTLGESSGLKIKPPESVKPILPKPKPITPKNVAHQSNSSKAARPDVNSAEYKDLINKFCYFGSPVDNIGNGIETPTSPPEESHAKIAFAEQMDETADSSSESNASVESSASNSPPSPKVQLHQVDAPESKSSSRSSSTIRGGLNPTFLPFRAPSPAVNSAFQEFPHQGLSVQTTQC